MSDPTSAHKPYTTGARPFSAAQKLNVVASTSGWVREQDTDSYKYYGNDNPATTPEVLVAIRNLSVRLGAATISGITWVTTVADFSAGFNLDAQLIYNQAVVVTGNPTITVTNSQAGGGSAATLVLAYLSSEAGGTDLTFRLVIGASSGTIAAGNVFSFGANVTLLAGGTIKGPGTTNAIITNTAAIGTTAGTLTVTA